jgi:Kef-type K+ transport system membrane component KefB
VASMSSRGTAKEPRLSRGLVLLSAALICGTVGAFLLIRSQGERLVAPAPTGPGFGSGAAVSRVEALPHLLLALAGILVASRLVGAVFRRLGQPPVIGEVLAGILLGPSFLGRVAPAAFAFLLPPIVVPYLTVLAQVGVILFMFMVGLELDTDVLRRGSRVTIAISQAGILVPFLLGSLLALALYPMLSSRDVPFTAFALFLAVSMSITAFPVLARILTDRGIQRTQLGVIALTCAAVNDVSAWCLLAFVVSVVKAQAAGAVVTTLLTAAYIAAVLALRPLVARLVRAHDHRGLTSEVMAVAFVALLISALVTEVIGIHAIFGAFLLGAVVPPDSRIAAGLRERIEGFAVVLLLPAFFALTGLRTQVALLATPRDWLLLGVIVLVASLGKFGGSTLAARLTGLAWREAAALGILMNTRGLVELIVLNIGLDLRVISPALFAMLVLMALLTTVATTPILERLRRSEATESPPDAASSLITPTGLEQRLPPVP